MGEKHIPRKIKIFLEKDMLFFEFLYCIFEWRTREAKASRQTQLKHRFDLSSYCSGSCRGSVLICSSLLCISHQSLTKAIFCCFYLFDKSNDPIRFDSGFFTTRSSKQSSNCGIGIPNEHQVSATISPPLFTSFGCVFFCLEVKSLEHILVRRNADGRAGPVAHHFQARGENSPALWSPISLAKNPKGGNLSPFSEHWD